MIKSITTFILTSIISITAMSKDIKPLNEIKLKNKFSMLIGVEIESLKNIAFYELINGWLGTKYKYAGNTKKGVDCSGFTKNIYQEIFGINLARTSGLQFKNSQPIIGELKLGDLVFFKINKSRISHVGIYLDNNKFIHSSVSKGVTISSLNDKYYKSKFYKAGRYE